MNVYQKNYGNFKNDINNNVIVQEILNLLNRNVSDSEKRSWSRSLRCVKVALDMIDIPNDVEVGLEYTVPLTNKRIDFVIAGEDDDNKKQIIIVELKQWDKVEHTDMNDIVLVGQKQHVHPSWQAFSYGSTLSNFNEFIELNDVNVSTCTFLHDYNMLCQDEIRNTVYEEGLIKAPAFLEQEWKNFADFIGTKIKKKSDVNILWEVKEGRIKPSKFLVDSLSSLLSSNSEIQLIDEQRIVSSNLKKEVYKALSSPSLKRKVIIVKGGAGTGKSLIALQLIGDLYKERGLRSFYVAKSSYVKESYFKKLTKDIPNYKFLRTLFRGSGDFHNDMYNTSKQFDCLVVDEAHRLTEKTKISYMFYGNNQIQEIIHASKVTIFFIDPTQQIDIKDFGTIENIKKASKLEDAEVLDDELFTLKSQFRCNGSDDYIAWVESVLYNKDYIQSNCFIDYDIRVVDTPMEMKKLIMVKNSLSKEPSRMLSGDVFDWKSKDDKTKIDIIIDDFQAQWNKKNTFAVDEKSIDEVGCIHTSQGMEFEYVGLIIGNDLIYRDGKVQTDYSKHPIKAGEFRRPHKKKININDRDIIDNLIRNTYKVLFTRGQKGLFIYVMDNDLKEYLIAKIKDIIKEKD